MRPQLTLDSFEHEQSHSSPGSACKVGRFKVFDETKDPVDPQSNDQSNDQTIDTSMSFLCKPRLTLHINHSPVNSPRSFVCQSINQSNHHTDFSATAPISGWLTPHDQSNNASNNSSHKTSPRDPRRFSYPPISTNQSFSRVSALTPVSQSSFFSQLEKRRAYQPRRGIDLTLETGKWFRTKFNIKLDNPPLFNQSVDPSYMIHVYELDALNGTSHLIGIVNQSDCVDHDIIAWQCQTSDCHLLLRLIDQSNQSIIGVATVQVSWLIESHSSHSVRFHHPADQSINEMLDKNKTSASFQLNHLTCYQSIHSLADYINESAHVKAAVLANNPPNRSNYMTNILSPSPVVRSITA